MLSNYNTQMQSQKINSNTTKKATTKLQMALMVLGMVFVAANLRAPLTSVGPVISEISESLNLSKVLAGMLTTIPLLAFATLSGFAPKVSKRVGLERLLLVSLALLTFGLWLRQWGSVASLFVGAALVGIAITVGNVLMPAFIKKSFSNNVGTMTGLYSVGMNLTAALAAGFSIKLGQVTQMGWQGSIGIWMYLSLFAFFIWLPQVKGRKAQNVNVDEQYKEPKVNLYKSKLAWSVTLFMGLQSLLFYSVAAWLPNVMYSWGMSMEEAGWVLSYIQFAQLPASFLGAVIAGKLANQKMLGIGIGLLFAIGFGGIMIFKTDYIVIWSICIGAASGLAFSVAMLLFVLRTNTNTQAIELSGMAQSFGYLLAASGPPIFGALFDITENWVYSLGFLMIASFALLYFGMRSGEGVVND